MIRCFVCDNHIPLIELSIGGACGSEAHHFTARDVVYCEFCMLPMCAACDTPTDFGHSCASCKRKVAMPRSIWTVAQNSLPRSIRLLPSLVAFAYSRRSWR